ncbi:hypothetical protein DYU11_22550 [Fibrisoma montanum]|uniref:Uncharacterized protein n=1 Tax=Fibrisoma montanum TaxID=2305895 RepID=A0A418M1V0_9BACT|nr:hypothetical protein [Fibrisoma montanum]RIV19712.1 hypothetical protein DYU11_22550 [Fibrisoma montanum]
MELPGAVRPVDLAFVLFFIFVGAGFQFVNTKNRENYSLLQRLYSQFAAIVFVGLLAMLALSNHWNVLVVAFAGFLVSIPAEKGLRLLKKYFDESANFGDFVQRLWKAYQMTRQNNSTNDDKP